MAPKKRPVTTPAKDNPPASLPDHPAQSMMFVQGDMLYSPGQFRSTLDSAWKMAVGGRTRMGDSQLAELYGSSSTAYACSNYAAREVSLIPLKVRTPTDETAVWHPLDYFLRDSRVLFWHIEIGLRIWARAYLRKIYNPYGYPTGLQWLYPTNVQIMRTYGSIIDYFQVKEDDGSYSQVKPNQMVYINRFDATGKIEGLSNFEVALRRIGIESSMVDFAGNFFFQGTRLDGLLVYKGGILSDGDMEKTKREWKANFKGSKNAYSTPILNGGEWEYQPISAAPEQLDMSAMDVSQSRAICAVMEVNPVLIGLANATDPLSASSTFESIQREHLLNVALPHHQEICDELNRQWLHVDFDPANHYSLESNRKAIDLLSKATGDNATTAVTLTSATAPLLDYNEGREFLGYEPRPGFLARDPAGAMSVWANGGTTWETLQRWLTGEDVQIPTGRVVLIGGQLLPVARLYEIAEANAKNLISPPPPPAAPTGFPPINFGPPAPPAPPSLPPPAPALPAVTPRLPDGLLPIKRDVGSLQSPGGCCLLSFASDPILTAASQFISHWVQSQGDVEAVFMLPNTFHITLMNTGFISNAQLSACMDRVTPPSPFPVRVTGLGVFEQEDKSVLYFAIEPNDGLIQLQQLVYDNTISAGVIASDYSKPENWTPHITIAYIHKGGPIPELLEPFEVTPSELHWTREVYKPALKLPMRHKGVRVGKHYELAFNLSRAQYLITCQRNLASQLSKMGVLAERWEAPELWRVTVAVIPDEVPPMDVINQIDGVALPKGELRTAEFEQEGGSVYLALIDTPTSAKVRAGLTISLDPFGLSPTSTYRALMAEGVGQLPEPLTIPQEGGYPIALDTLTLFADGDPRLSWGLRSRIGEQREELRNWAFRVKRKGRGVPFETTELTNTPTARFIRMALCLGMDQQQVFDQAKMLLTRADTPTHEDIPDAPKLYERFWGSYDNLMNEVGDVWLEDYMSRAWTLIESETRKGQLDQFDVWQALTEYRTDLAEVWVGSDEKPGIITRLLLAGMAAGTNAIVDNAPADYRSSLRAIQTSVDWELLSRQALQYAKSYVPQLIRGLDQTTASDVAQKIADWLVTGEPVETLANTLDREIFHNPARATNIAQTESNRVFNEGAYVRYETAGITKARWNTVHDGLVCPICKPLDGLIFNFRDGWVHPGGAGAAARYKGQKFTHPAHPRDRCFSRPVVESAEPTKPQPEQPKPEQLVKASGDTIKTRLKSLSGQFKAVRDGLESEDYKQFKAIREKLNDDANQAFFAYRAARDKYEAETDPAKKDELWGQVFQLEWEYDQARQRRKDAIEKFGGSPGSRLDYAINSLSYGEPTPATIKPNNPANFTEMQRKRMAEGEEFLRNICDGRVIDQIYTEASTSNNPVRESHMYGTIFINRDSPTGVILHETGHAIEWRDSRIHELCVDFLRYRAGSEAPKQLNQILGTSGYGSNEVAVADSFPDAYAGKVYGNWNGTIGATEILSMGLEYLFNDPVAFSVADPEYFDFIIGIVRGWLI